MSTPDYFRHEALDRTHLIIDMIASHLIDHPYIADRPEHARRVSAAFEALSSLYQDIGREHLFAGKTKKTRPHIPAVPAPPPTLETARRIMDEHADTLRALKDR